MKKTIIGLILVVITSICQEATAQSALGISWVMYPTIDHKNPLPLQPAQPNIIRVYLNNTGDHAICIKNLGAFISFDTTKNSVDLGKIVAKNNLAYSTFEMEIQPLTQANNLAYFYDFPPNYHVDKSDSIAMQEGRTILFMVVKYWDYYQQVSRIYTCEMTLKDHHSPQTLTDQVIYKEDIKEDLDSIIHNTIRRPMLTVIVKPPSKRKERKDRRRNAAIRKEGEEEQKKP